jgi:hypothetical protein
MFVSPRPSIVTAEFTVHLGENGPTVEGAQVEMLDRADGVHHVAGRALVVVQSPEYTRRRAAASRTLVDLLPPLLFFLSGQFPGSCHLRPLWLCLGTSWVRFGSWLVGR